MDMLVTNGVVVTMNKEMEIIENGAVYIKDDSIVQIGPKNTFSDIIAEETIDARGGIIMPGLINTHTHASMTLFRGLADDMPLMDWLNDHIFPAESKLTEDMVYKGAMLACAEMILSGTTCFCDMYLFEDKVAEAAFDSGMRAVTGEVLYDFPSPCYGDLTNGFNYVSNMMEKWKNNSRITIAVEPHSTYLCAPELLKKAAAAARKNKNPIVIHLAETEEETALIKEKYGTTPVKFLADLGILGPDLIACHCIHITEEDIQLLKKFDVKIAHCPESNMKLGSGIAPVPELIKRGICVSLGTDGCASNNDLDLFLEMDTTAKLHKIFTMNPEAINAETALKMATINGAVTLGLNKITGSLEVGKKADIIVIDTSKPHMVPMYNPYSHLVYSANGSDVSATIIDGNLVMKDRKILKMNLWKIMDDVKEISKIIKKADHSF